VIALAKSRKPRNKAGAVGESAEAQTDAKIEDVIEVAADAESKSELEPGDSPQDPLSQDADAATDGKTDIGEDTRTDGDPASEDAPESPENSTNAVTPDEGEPRDEKEGEEEKASAVVPVVQPAPAPQRSVFWPLVFGGIVAALLGFVAGRGDLLDSILPASSQGQSVDLTELETRTAALQTASNELETRVQSLEAQPAQPDLGAAVDELKTALSAFEERLSAAEAGGSEISALSAEALAGLEARIASVEALPGLNTPVQEGVSSEEILALQAALDAQRAEIQALAEKADAAEQLAKSEAAQLLASAAVTRVVTAVETGASFEPAINDLEEVGAVEIPDALRANAATGVPTLAMLTSEFPDAARSALAAARSETPESDVVGLTGFIRRQLSVRSVTPRDGDGADAILSRAEAALRGGDLPLTLSELESLPDTAKAAMQDWLVAAKARQAAQDAADSLANSLTSN
jgi:hypothetical protein